MRVGAILVMGAVALLQLVEAENKENLPFGARLRVRRVRSKATSKPFTINWANLSNNNNNKSPRKEKQIQKFPYLPPPADLDYGDDDVSYDVLSDSYEPAFDIPTYSSEEEADVEPPVINPVSPSPSLSTGGSPVSTGGSTSSDDSPTVWSIDGPTVWSVDHPKKEKPIEKFPADLDYGDDVSDDNSNDPVFSIDSSEEEADIEPPVINPNVPGVIINPVSPSPSLSIGGSSVTTGGSPVSTGGSTLSIGGSTVSNSGSTASTGTSTGSRPVSLVPGPWVTVSENDPLPLQPGPWIPVSNLPDPQEFIQTTVFIDNPSISPITSDTPFQDPISEDFYNPAIQNFDPVFQNFNPIIQNFDPAVQNFDPIIQNVDPVIQNFDTQIQNFDPVIQNFDSQIQNVDTIIQNVDPINIEVPQEVVTGPKCQTITETIVEEEREQRCRIIGESSCYKATLDTPTKFCSTVSVNQCEDVVEPQFRETCTDNFVNNCENVIETFNRNICNFVNQTVCEQVEETWYKDECQYEVVYEEVCSVNYVTVRYKTECQYEVELPQETGQDPEANAQVSQKPSYKPQGQKPSYKPQGQVTSSGETEKKPSYILPQADRLPKKTKADRLPKKAFPPRLRVPSSNSRTPRSSDPEPLSPSLRVPRFAFKTPIAIDPRPPCKKVPVREPVKTCRNVPRDDEVCRQVPVVRLVPKCEQQERVLCEAVPYQQQIQRCQLTNSPVCSTEAAGEAVRKVCQEIPTEVCELEAELLEAEDSDEDSSEESNERCEEQERPLRVCETRLIPVTRTVEREIGECNGDIKSSDPLDPTSEEPPITWSPSGPPVFTVPYHLRTWEHYQTTFL